MLPFEGPGEAIAGGAGGPCDRQDATGGLEGVDARVQEDSRCGLNTLAFSLAARVFMFAQFALDDRRGPLVHTSNGHSLHP